MAGTRDRDARERARLYQARQQFHRSRVRRRRRDDLVAGVVGGVIVLAAIGAQTAYFTVGPGTPEPAPSPSSTMSADPTPDPTATGGPAPTTDPAPDVTTGG